jgi:pilus assembly protein TadC
VIRSVDLGARWRDELRSASDRLPLPDLRRAVATMDRAESLGSSLADALSELATEVRDARHSAATERARKAPVKMLSTCPAYLHVRGQFLGAEGAVCPHCA